MSPSLHDLPLAVVYPNPKQPRTQFDDGALEDLAASIAARGLQQPIKVRPDGEGRFMVVCGERRYRAHLRLGLETIPAIVESMSDDDLADVAIIENLHRKDITPLEEARAFQRRLDTGLTVDELAKRLGIKQPHRITERTALLKLAPEFQEAFSRGMLSPSQAYEMSRLGCGYQRVLFNAIRGGRCRTYQELRAVTMALQKSEAAGTPALFQVEHDEQPSLFADQCPTPEERKMLTAMEARIEKVEELLRGGFKDNEVVIVAKVNRRNADTMAQRLELIEKQLAKLRLALRAAVVAPAA